MSYTVTQKATTPNAAYTRLIYTVSGSSKVSQPQFSYLVDIYESGSTDRLQRIVQGVNPAGVSIFDPSRLFQGELKEDQSWKISSVTPYVSSSKTFTLEFGEQYGTSVSSSIAVSSSIRSENIEVIRNVVEPNNGISYNWQSSSYAVLSNMPATMSMQVDDYGTISVYNNDVSYVSQSFYSSSATGSVLVQEKNYSITDNFSSIPISASTPYWNNAEINVSSSIGLQSYKYEVSDETHREKTRFAFINKLGTWDYYNNYNPVRQELSVLREQYTAARVDYSSLTSTYDISRKGLTSYHSTADDTFMVDTDYLDKTNANWLEELLESPSVFIQRDGEFMPIIITDSSYTANTNQARQKLFQYVITFRPSNQPFGKWEPEYVSCPNVSSTPPVVETNAFTNIELYSFTLNGEVTNNGNEEIVERGFAYSTSSLLPDISSSNSVKVTSGTGDGLFASNIVSASHTTRYYARAYASNSLGLAYGDVEEALTDEYIFDPTLDGAIQPYFWYDMSDTGSMILSSSAAGWTGNNAIYAVQSKGSNTGWVSKGMYTSSIVTTDEMEKYSGSIVPNSKDAWQAASTENGFAFFNSSENWRTGVTAAKVQTNSTMARLWDTGSFSSFYTMSGDGGAGDAFPKADEAWTTIVFQRPFFNYNGSTPLGAKEQSMIGFRANKNKPSLASGNGFPFDLSFSTLNIDQANTSVFYSDSTASISGSYFNPRLQVTGQKRFTYNYSGSDGSWESRYIKYDGTTGSIQIGREPDNVSQTYFASESYIYTGSGVDTLENLSIGSVISDNTQAISQPPFYLSHFLAYTQSLSNEQIQAVIDDYKVAVSNRSQLTLNPFDN
tara:strand:- start:5132 stop:7651 length:2520 start_codon:yes stop_codon:yes gene_type:complete